MIFNTKFTALILAACAYGASASKLIYLPAEVCNSPACSARPRARRCHSYADDDDIDGDSHSRQFDHRYRYAHG